MKGTSFSCRDFFQARSHASRRRHKAPNNEHTHPHTHTHTHTIYNHKTNEFKINSFTTYLYNSSRKNIRIFSSHYKFLTKWSAAAGYCTGGRLVASSLSSQKIFRRTLIEKLGAHISPRPRMWTKKSALTALTITDGLKSTLDKIQSSPHFRNRHSPISRRGESVELRWTTSCIAWRSLDPF